MHDRASDCRLHFFAGTRPSAATFPLLFDPYDDVPDGLRGARPARTIVALVRESHPNMDRRPLDLRLPRRPAASTSDGIGRPAPPPGCLRTRSSYVPPRSQTAGAASMSLTERWRSSPGRTRESASGSPRSWRGSGADVVLNSFTDSPEDHALAERIADEHGVRAVYVAADMSERRRLPRARRAGRARRWAGSTSWSTTPASSTSRRSPSSRRPSGTRSSRSTSPRPSTPPPPPCR